MHNMKYNLHLYKKMVEFHEKQTGCTKTRYRIAGLSATPPQTAPIIPGIVLTIRPGVFADLGFGARIYKGYETGDSWLIEGKEFWREVDALLRRCHMTPTPHAHSKPPQRMLKESFRDTLVCCLSSQPMLELRSQVTEFFKTDPQVRQVLKDTWGW